MAKTFEEMMAGGYDQIAWPDDGVVNFTFLGQEVVDTQYGDRVKLAVYDLLDQRETAIYTASKKLLNQLFKDLKIQIGDKVVCKRTGKGFQVAYESGIIERNNAPKQEVITANQAAAIIDAPVEQPKKPAPKKFKIEDGSPFQFPSNEAKTKQHAKKSRGAGRKTCLCFMS